jgi:glutamyl-tRNA synthetase
MMHWGNASTALLAWLQVRAGDGRMLLRMEDVDPQRSKPAFAEGWRRDLAWLGLDWDEEVAPQSQRGQRYAEALDLLADQGLVFACRCTRRDMDEAVSAPHGSFMGSYPGTCADGRWPPGGPGARRLRSPDDAVVLRRADGAWAYQLAVVTDDVDQGVTHVLRGRDLADSVPLQLFVHRALGNPQPPEFAHAPLWMGPDGHRLSKRHGAVGVRDSGLTAAQGVGLLAHALGLRDRPEACTPAELIDDWRARGPATLACGEVAAASFLPLPL